MANSLRLVIAGCHPKRSRWRFTFRRLTSDAQKALRGHDVNIAAQALEKLIDVAWEANSYDLFRSDDAVEAARFVVSDVVAAIWARYRDEYGIDEMLKLAVEHMRRWESRHRWTRTGSGRVPEQERSLASFLDGYLKIPDLWASAARYYLDALGRVWDYSTTERSIVRSVAHRRTEELSEWHQRLIDQLIGSEDEELLDRLATHQALEGPERTFLQARLARERGDIEAASSLIQDSLKPQPGHPEFKRFAEELAELSPAE